MTCRYCGKKIPDGSSYCPSCGKRIEAHLRAEDREKEKKEYEYKPERDDEYVESRGKRFVKSLISIIAAIIFVVGAFIAIMIFAKPYLGEEPWSVESGQTGSEEENIGFPRNMYVSAEDGLLLWEEPGTGKAIHLLNYGIEIQVDKIEDGWAYTTVDGLSGWCSAESLTENKDEIRQTETKPESEADKSRLAEPSRRIVSGYHGTVNSEDGLNLRCGPGRDYDILLVVPYKTEVVEEGWENGWIYVSYDGQYGWLNSEYITPTGEVERE